MVSSGAIRRAANNPSVSRSSQLTRLLFAGYPSSKTRLWQPYTLHNQCRHASNQRPAPPSRGASASPTKARASPLGKPLPPSRKTTKIPAQQLLFRDIEQSVEAAGGSVLLFKAPSHGSYIGACYSTATCAWIYAVYGTYNQWINPLTDLSIWLKVPLGLIQVIMFGLGMLALSRARNVVSTITAKHADGRTRVYIGIRRWNPFMRRKEISADLTELSLWGELANAETRRAISILQERQKVLESTPFLKAPGKKISIFFWSIFTNIKRAFAQHFFSYLIVKQPNRERQLRLDELGEITPEFGKLCDRIGKTGR